MQRRLERLGLADKPGEWAERYLLCEKLVDPSRPGRLFALRYTMEQSNETSHPPYVRKALLSRSFNNDDLLPKLRKPVLITHGTDDAVVKSAVIDQ
jgi:pimeloyl-ACP methyl ester carboxylesterase